MPGRRRAGRKVKGTNAPRSSAGRKLAACLRRRGCAGNFAP